MRLRLLTYNIHKGIGGADRKYRLERIIETLNHYEPDIAFLQEVDEGVPRSRHHRQAEMLSEALALPHFAYQRNVKLKIGAYGNAILSRYPLHDIHNVNLTVPLKKRRRALVARCKVQLDGHIKTIQLLNTHLGLAGFERQHQLRRLLKDNSLQHTSSRTPVILGGDFNDVWGRLGKGILLPAGYRSVAKNLRTFPAILPVRPLDRIYCRGPVQVDHAFVGHTKLSRQASDHLPLIADIHLEVG